MLISAVIIMVSALWTVTFYGEILSPGLFSDFFDRAGYLLGALYRMKPALAYAGRLFINGGSLKYANRVDYLTVIRSIPMLEPPVPPTAVYPGPSIWPSVSPSGVKLTIDFLIFIPIIWVIFTLFLSVIYVIMCRTNGARPVFVAPPQPEVRTIVEAVDDKPVFIITNPYISHVGIAPFEIPFPPLAFVTPLSSVDSFSGSPISLVLAGEQAQSGVDYYQEVDTDLASIKLSSSPPRETDVVSAILAENDVPGPGTSTSSPTRTRSRRRRSRKGSAPSSSDTPKRKKSKRSVPRADAKVTMAPLRKVVLSPDPPIPPKANTMSSTAHSPPHDDGWRVVVKRKGKLIGVAKSLS